MIDRIDEDVSESRTGNYISLMRGNLQKMRGRLTYHF